MSDKKKTTRISACGIVVDEQDRILLCRLSNIVDKHAGLWHLPGGGIDYGEDPRFAIIREIKEETNLCVKEVNKLLDVNSVILEFEAHLSHAIRIIYDVSVIPGKIIVEKNGSTDAAAWFTLEEAKQLPLTSLAEHGIKLFEKKIHPLVQNDM